MSERNNVMKAYFITGTDTDVGKTVVTASLLKAFASLGHAVRAIKPVQTGCYEVLDKNGDKRLEAPDVLVWQKAQGTGQVLEKFSIPASPHLAARINGRELAAKELANACLQNLDPYGITLLEGAGGLYVPLNESEFMLDLAKFLRLPILLVVGNKLGCINHALLSLNAIENEGLDVVGMILCRTSPANRADAGTDNESEAIILEENHTFLAKECKKRGIPLLASLPYCPELHAGQSSAWEKLSDEMRETAQYLAQDYPALKEETAEVLCFDRQHLWHPYTSATKPLRTYETRGTCGTSIYLGDGTKLVDGMSSWWCAIHGYGNKKLVDAIQKQSARFSHVMFGGLTHKPAVELGRKLLKLLPPTLEHIFYADSGSVAVEVASKMVIQYWRSLGKAEKRHFVALCGAYHGDTFGAMALCDPITGMHALFKDVLPEHFFVERPACRFDAPYDRETFAPMREMLKSHYNEIAAVFVEPIVQGAGGMWFYHPQYLNDLRMLCDELDILLVTDEIATGFGRTGKLFACEWTNISPDIMCVGKALTGGMMTLSAVIANQRVVTGISNAPKELGGGIFMHGPTFMANPLACAVACASIDELLSSPWRERVANLETGLAKGLAPCKGMRGVKDVRVLGAIGVVEMDAPVQVEAWQEFFVKYGVWIRPFGKTVYLMPPFITDEADLAYLCDAICAAVFSASCNNKGIPQ